MFISALGIRYLPRGIGLEKNHEGLPYDVATGLLTASMNAIYSYRVLQDFRDVYAETIALEQDKPVKNIGISDFLFYKGDNGIIQQTRWNFIKESILRFSTDLIAVVPRLLHWEAPFAKKNPVTGKRPPMSGADLLLGAKAGLLTMSNMSRAPLTTFEQLVEFIDSKINSHKAFGNRISTADIARLYNNYMSRHAPEKMYTENGGKGEWEKSGEAMFDRIAALMNQSYRYKRTPEEKDQPVQNFRLPQLLYLMGHDMIDPLNVECSSAYIEVVNRYGVPAVKDLSAMVEKNGIPLEEALRKYPLNPQILVQPEPAPKDLKPVTPDYSLANDVQQPQNVTVTVGANGGPHVHVQPQPRQSWKDAAKYQPAAAQGGFVNQQNLRLQEAEALGTGAIQQGI